MLKRYNAKLSWEAYIIAIKRQGEKSATKMELGSNSSVEGSTTVGNLLMVEVGLYYCYTLKIFKCSYLMKADGLH